MEHQTRVHPFIASIKTALMAYGLHRMIDTDAVARHVAEMHPDIHTDDIRRQVIVEAIAKGKAVAWGCSGPGVGISRQ
jgi:hypothetical protein